MASPIIEGFVVGILAAINILYAFQTRVAYPDFVLNVVNHPWILVLTFVLALFMVNWSVTAGCLLIIALAAFAIDIYIFARPLPGLLSESPSDQLSHQSAASAIGNDERDASTHMAPPLNNVSMLTTDPLPLPTPMYPTFYSSINDVRGGPAPF